MDRVSILLRSPPRSLGATSFCLLSSRHDRSSHSLLGNFFLEHLLLQRPSSGTSSVFFFLACDCKSRPSPVAYSVKILPSHAFGAPTKHQRRASYLPPCHINCCLVLDSSDGEARFFIFLSPCFHYAKVCSSISMCKFGSA